MKSEYIFLLNSQNNKKYYYENFKLIIILFQISLDISKNDNVTITNKITPKCFQNI